MTSIQKWGSYTLDQVDKVDSAIESIAGGIMYTLEEGDNVLRFLPPLLGKDSPFRVTAQHFVKGLPGLDKGFSFACPRHELRQQCFVCQRVEELQRSPIAADRKSAKDWSAGLRVYANVFPKLKPDMGVRVLPFGKMIWEDLKKIRKSPRLGGDFTNPGPNGFDVIINREGKEMSTRYTTAADRASSPLAVDDATIEAIIMSQHDLEALVEPVAPEELLAALGISIRQQVQVAQSLLPTGGRLGGSLPSAAQPASSSPGLGAGLMQRPAQQTTLVDQAPVSAVHAQPVRTAVQDADTSDGGDTSFLDD